jgi:hypothetical protein
MNMNLEEMSEMSDCLPNAEIFLENSVFVKTRFREVNFFFFTVMDRKFCFMEKQVLLCRLNC